jgi:hypothetical protein
VAEEVYFEHSSQVLNWYVKNCVSVADACVVNQDRGMAHVGTNCLSGGVYVTGRGDVASVVPDQLKLICQRLIC